MYYHIAVHQICEHVECRFIPTQHKDFSALGGARIQKILLTTVKFSQKNSYFKIWNHYIVEHRRLTPVKLIDFCFIGMFNH